MSYVITLKVVILFDGGIIVGMFNYYIIAPIEGLHSTFDFRMYSAEVFGNYPNYTPIPQVCPTFHQPYDHLGSFLFGDYPKLTDFRPMDDLTFKSIAQLPPNTKLKNYTCVAFETELNENDFGSPDSLDSNEKLLQHLLDKGERILDVLRLCLFKPGEDKSIGSFGALGNGVLGLWLAQNNKPPKFIARKVSRYQLVQKPIDITPTDFGPIYYDMTFRGLSVSACSSANNTNPTIQRVFNALRAFRESREMQNWEARFRHLTSIAESLAHKTPQERLQGRDLRDRIAQIATTGWEIYTSYTLSALPPQLDKEGQQQIHKRHDEMGWTTEDAARNVVKDLWTNVRNKFSHTDETFSSLKRDPVKDTKDLERVLITMINGICAAYEVEEFYEGSIYDILLNSSET